MKSLKVLAVMVLLGLTVVGIKEIKESEKQIPTLMTVEIPLMTMEEPTIVSTLNADEITKFPVHLAGIGI